VVDNGKFIASCNFTTDRLLVENWNAVLMDEPARNRLMTDLSVLLSPAVTEFLPEPLKLTKDPNALDRWIEDRRQVSEVFCAWDKKTRALLGLLILAGFDRPEGGMTIRLGYLLAEQTWGKGVATELVNGLVRWVEDQPMTVQILAGVEKENPASAAVLIKAGFEKTAETEAGESETFQLVL
jgi:RimJ/RimL family protein N-acetyltransferase